MIYLLYKRSNGLTMHCANVPRNSTCIPVNAVHYMILSSAYFVANDALHYMIADIWAY